MRLRLIIRRHNVPDAQVLWSSTGLHTVQQSNTTKPTIAQFLQEVNEIFPLETEELGLEDYVVELAGFECVHFSPLEGILKEDDQVVIRPLQLNDRRFRRVSGRVQIAADGRKLYDGVAFGRPFLKRAARPPVRLPAVKRQRLSHDAEDQNEEHNQSDGEDEYEYEYNEDMSSEEIAALASEVAQYEEDRQSVRLESGRNTRKRQYKALGIDTVRESPSVNGSVVRHHRDNQLRRPSSNGSLKNVRFQNEELETPATILAEEESDESSDQNFEDDSDNGDSSDDSEANKENVAPITRLGAAYQQQLALQRRLQETAPTGAAENGSSSCDMSTPEADSQDNTESSSEDSSEDDSDGTSVVSPSESSDESSSDDSDSSSASESEPTSLSELHQTTSKTAQRNVSTVNRIVKQDSSRTKPGSDATRITVAPGQGKTATHRRNIRRKTLQKAQIAERRDAESRKAEQDGKGDAADEDHAMTGDLDDEAGLATKKAALLRDLGVPSSSQAIDAQERTFTMAADTTANISMVSLPSKAREASEAPSELSSKQQPSTKQQDDLDTNLVGETSLNLAADEPIQMEVDEQQQPPSSRETNSRRAKLDVEGAQRLLFGSLGHRAPKTKEDADKLRTKFVSAAEKLPGNSLGKSKEVVNEAESVQSEVDDESWKEKIVLSAVECSYEGVEYSAPPFPFVQRWDPQQQYSTKRKGKRGGGSKRQKRNNQNYYQTEHTEYGYDYDEAGEEADQSHHEQAPATTNDNPDFYEDTTMHEADDAEAASHQLLEKSHVEVDEEEFPELPKDVSVLPVLGSETALVGSIIAFKQMDMSEQTNWSPVISDYRTAKIETVLENDILRVLFAPRDVPQSQKMYDQETGERLYSKFEMPDDDDVGSEDERILEIGLQDMIDPRLVKAISQSEEQSTSLQEVVEVVKDVASAGIVLLKAASPDSPAPATNVNGELQSVEADSHVQSVEADAEEEQSTPISKFRDRIIPPSSPITRETPRAREPSIELGSEGTPARFFSEVETSQPSDERNQMDDEDDDGYVPFEDEEDHHDPLDDDDEELPDTAEENNDDPSIWNPVSASHEDDTTKFFSAGAEEDEEHQAKTPSRPISPIRNETSNTREALTTPSSRRISKRPSLSSPVQSSLQRESSSPSPDQHVIAEVHPEDDMEPALLIGDEDPEDSEEEEDTFTQDSIRAKVINDREDTPPVDTQQSDSGFNSHSSSIRSAKVISLEDDEVGAESDDNSGSSSIPSLNMVLSQQLPRSVSPPRLTSKKRANGNYPKISSAAHEGMDAADSFVFSQAPKRLVSDTHKIAVAYNDSPLNTSSQSMQGRNPYSRGRKDPYELSATAEIGSGVKSEDEEPELPSFSTQDISLLKTKRKPSLFRRGPSGIPTATQPAPKTRDTQSTSVIDLTLSSDPVEPDQAPLSTRRASSRRSGSQLPSGPGWQGKASTVNEKSSTKSKGLFRTKSLV